MPQTSFVKNTKGWYSHVSIQGLFSPRQRRDQPGPLPGLPAGPHLYRQRAPAARAAAGGRRAKRRPHPKGRHPRPGAGPADQDGGARHPVPPFPHRYDPALPAHPGAESAGEQEGFRQADRARAHPAGDAAGKGVLRPAVSDGAWGGAALILSGIQRHGAGLFAGGNSRAGRRAQKYPAPDSAGKVWPGPDRKGPLPPARPGDRPGKGDRPGGAHPLTAQQKQPLPHRGGGGWQDRHRGRTGAAHRPGPGSKIAAGQASDRAGLSLDGSRHQVPRRV